MISDKEKALKLKAKEKEKALKLKAKEKEKALKAKEKAKKEKEKTKVKKGGTPTDTTKYTSQMKALRRIKKDLYNLYNSYDKYNKNPYSVVLDGIKQRYSKILSEKGPFIDLNTIAPSQKLAEMEELIDKINFNYDMAERAGSLLKENVVYDSDGRET